jgi:molybdate transport system substrate-binding protein
MAGLAVEVAINRWLKPAFEADTGLRLDIDWRPTAAIMKSIEAGDRADVIIGIDNSMDKLVEAGIVQAATRVMLADSILGVGVKRGAMRPDLSTARPSSAAWSRRAALPTPRPAPAASISPV